MGVEAVALIVTAVIGVEGIAATIIAGVIVAAASAAISYGLQAALAPKAPKGTTAADSARTQQVRQPITARRVVIGRVKLSGPLFFVHSNKEALIAERLVSGSVSTPYKAQELLFTAVALASHPIAYVESIEVNSTPITDAKFAGYAYVEPHLGAEDQAASPMLVAETGGKWTENHRARGVAYLAGSFRYDQALWSSVPNMAATIYGLSQIYDPRNGSTGYSNNAALVAAWYLTSPDGLGCSWDEIDQDALIAAANICDEAVPLLSGSTEPRYAINGTIDLDQAPGSIIQDIAVAMAGWIIQTGGQWTIMAGAWSEPSVTVGESDLRGDIGVQANRPARDIFNAVRSTYIRPSADWQATDAPVRYDEAAIAADGGEVHFTDLDFPMTTSGYAVQRLGQIALRRVRQQRTVSLKLNLMGLRIRCGDVVSFGTARLPTATYRVTRWSLALDDNGGIGADVTLAQEDASVWAWNAATDELPLGDVASADLPGGATLAAPTVTVTTPTAPTPSTVMVSSTPVPGALLYETQSQVPGGVWVGAGTASIAAVVPVTGPAAFRARARGVDEIGLWGVADLPAAVSYMNADGTPDGIYIAWIAPDAAGVQVFAGDTATFSASTYQGTAASPTDDYGLVMSGGISKYIWVRAVNAAGNFSVPLGPVSAVSGEGGAGGSVGTPPPGGGGGGGSGGDGE